MTDFLIKCGKYAPLLTAVLLVWSAVSPPKPNAKWSGRCFIGAMGIALLYASIHMIVRSK